MSIGYETQIPPITTVNFYNGIANNGKLLQPRLVKAIMRGGEVVENKPIVVLREQMAKPEAVKNIQDILESVVSVGLGKKAGSRYFHVSGKTGTAQVWTKSGFASQYLVSFAGYFPSEKPLYSCIVCIQKGAPASGGGMCAPVFKRVAETVMAQRLSNNYSTARDSFNCLNPVIAAGNIHAAQTVLDQLGIAYNSGIDTEKSSLTWGACQTSNNGLNVTLAPQVANDVVPDVCGYGLRDVLFRLEKMGLKVKVRGVGCVTQQSLQPGYRFKPGEEISLILGDAKDIPIAEQDSVKDDAQAQQTQATQQPEDPELTPTLADEKKYKENEQQTQQELKQQKAEKAAQNREEQKKKKEEKSKKPSKQPAVEPKQKKETKKPSDKTSKSSQTKLAAKKKTSDSKKKTTEHKKER